MKFYGIKNTQGVESTVRLREGGPDLLALDHWGRVLPLFGVDTALPAFVRRHPLLRANGSEYVETALIGASFVEVAELISPAVESGKVETVVFDPMLDTKGEWVSEAFEWSAENFCDLMTVVGNIARRQEGVPADCQPSPKAVRKAMVWYAMRLLLYRLDLLAPFDSLRRYLGGRA